MKIKMKNRSIRTVYDARMRRLFLRLLLMLAPVSSFALSEGDYTYVTDESGHAIITGFSASYSGALTVADTLGGLPVVAIGDSAFGCCSNLTSVTFQAGITRVGEGAFAGCTRLRSAYFMGTVPEAGTTVFNADSPTTVYHLPETHGWGESFAGRPTELWQTFTYTVEGGSVTITGYSGPGNQMVIPSSILGKPVTAIGDHAFECNANLTGVAFPDTILSIGSYAFAICSELKELRLPDRLTEIKSSAFMGCRGLTNVIFGCNVTTIGERAFYDCVGLTQLVLPASLASIGDYVFNSCTGLQDLYFRGDCPSVGLSLFDPNCPAIIHRPTEKWTWPQTFADRPVVEWEEYAWWNAAGEAIILGYNGPEREITIPSSILGLPVTGIYDGAFTNHSDLTSVTFPDSLYFIGDHAFAGCTRLTRLDLPEELYQLNTSAFEGCSSLVRVSLPMNGTRYYANSLGDFVFRSCTNLQEVVFKGDEPYFGTDVFENDTLCTIYRLPDKSGWGSVFAGRPTALQHTFICATNESSLTVIGHIGFGGEVEIPSSLGGLPVTAIADEAFYGQADFSRVTIPNSVTSVGARAFQNCFGLKDVVLGSGVASLGERAFARCCRLSQVTIPATACRIGAGAFAGCASLHTITVEDGNPSYCSRDGVLFDRSLQTLIQCPGVREGIYDIPDSVTAVSDYAFENCFNLTRVMCPAGLASVGSRAFAWCASLQAIYFRGDAPVSATGVFDGDSPSTV